MDKDGEVEHRELAALVAYLALLESGWDEMTDRQKREGVRLSLQVARRAATELRSGRRGWLLPFQDGVHDRRDDGS
jgi:hypothetical protein